MTDFTLNPGGSAPFNLTMLGEALCRRMVEAFATFKLRVANPDLQGAAPLPETLEAVTIYLGSVKGRERDSDSKEVGPQFPLVLVKPRACTDDSDDNGAQRSTVQVDFMIGVRRIGNDGYLDVTAILERIRTNLLLDPVIETRARMELPLESDIGEDDAFPQWYGVVSAKFSIPQPVEETDLVSQTQ